MQRPEVRQPELTAPAFGLESTEHCGYSLTSFDAPFTALFITWTVPNLRFTPSDTGPNKFRTFVGLGFLDVHVEMTIDSAQNVTAIITRYHSGGFTSASSSTYWYTVGASVSPEGPDFRLSAGASGGSFNVGSPSRGTTRPVAGSASAASTTTAAPTTTRAATATT